MSGKYWDMYKGKTKYDDDLEGEGADAEVVNLEKEEKLDEDASDVDLRQTPEDCQPEQEQYKEERRRAATRGKKIKAGKPMMKWALAKGRMKASVPPREWKKKAMSAAVGAAAPLPITTTTVTTAKPEATTMQQDTVIISYKVLCL